MGKRVPWLVVNDWLTSPPRSSLVGTARMLKRGSWLRVPSKEANRPVMRRKRTAQRDGTLHPAVLDRIGVRWTARDERLLRIFARVVHVLWPLVPYRLRFSPRSRAAMERVAVAR